MVLAKFLRNIVKLFYLANCFEPTKLSDELINAGFDENQINDITSKVSRAFFCKNKPYCNFEPFDANDLLTTTANDDDNSLLQKTRTWLLSNVKQAFSAEASTNDNAWQEKCFQEIEKIAENFNVSSPDDLLKSISENILAKLEEVQSSKEGLSKKTSSPTNCFAYEFHFTSLQSNHYVSLSF